MGIGIALGGLADSLNTNRKLDIEEQQKKFQQDLLQQQQGIEAYNAVFKEISGLVKAQTDAGRDPKELANNPTWVAAVNQVSALGESIKRPGFTPQDTQARANAMLLRPPLEDSAAKAKIVNMPDPNNPFSPGVPHVLNPDNTATPIRVAPGTTNGATFAPPPGTPPVAAAPTAPAQVAQGGAASDAPQPGVTPAQPTVTQPPPRTPQEAVARNVTGDEFLATLPKEVQPVVKGIANYQIDPKSLSIKGGHREQILAAAMQYSNHTYDQKFYNSMNAAVKEFLAGGAQSPAGQITYGNVAIQHLGTLLDSIEKMKAVPGLLDKIAKSNTPIASYAAEQLKNRSIRGTSEGQALAAFIDARERYSGEIARFYAGGPGSEGQRQRSMESLDAAYSPSELLSVVRAESELLNGKVNVLQDRWKTAMAGPRLFDATIRSKVPDFPLIQDKTRVTLDKIKGATEQGPTTGGVVDWTTYFGKK
jgi:hypothetical protein